MLSIEEINLLKTKNEELQKENNHLQDLYNQALKDYDETLQKCEQYIEVLKNIKIYLNNIFPQPHFIKDNIFEYIEEINYEKKN